VGDGYVNVFQFVDNEYYKLLFLLYVLDSCLNLFQDSLYLAEKLFQLGTRSSQFSLYVHNNRKCASYKISVRVFNVNHTDV
jgi:hypothetical protein